MTDVAVAAERAAIESVREFELEEARALQQAMVPANFLRVHPVEVASCFRPVTAVGGDFLDYFALTESTMGLYVGDVVGKGLPAALYAALAVGTLRGINKTGEAPTQVLDLLNRRLWLRSVKDRFCMVQYALLDLPTRLLRYANAGLPGPFHISARGCHELRHGGLPVGMFDGTRYEEATVQLERGDAVLFLTDGLTEAGIPGESEFGMKRIAQLCEENYGAPAARLLERIFAAADDFAAGLPQHDDMTAAVLKLD